MESLAILTPIGFISIALELDHLVSIQFIEQNSSPSSAKNPLLQEVEKQLLAYFEGKLQHFDLPLKPIGTDFQLRVWKELQNISYGKTISYLQLAEQLGDIKIIRSAGTANGKNPIPIVIPCHRVIGVNGKMIGYSGGITNKKWLLQHEKNTIGIGQTE